MKYPLAILTALGSLALCGGMYAQMPIELPSGSDDSYLADEPADLEEQGQQNASLPSNAQKNVGRALQALRTNKLNEARNYLLAAQRTAPQNAEIEYLLGVYCSRSNQPAEARVHWKKTLQMNPKQMNALLELSHALLRENKPEEAIAYLDRARATEPSSWRVQVLLAEALYMQGRKHLAIKHAERARELGHERAAPVELFLARVLAESGETERATQILQAYLTANPGNALAANELTQWKNSGGKVEGNRTAAIEEIEAASVAATALPLPFSWYPPDVDEKVPPTDASAGCMLQEVMAKTEKRIVEWVRDLDKFTATEILTDQTIDKWGMASASDKRKFTYVVTIEQVGAENLGVIEYRSGRAGSEDFPNGIVTNGLPAMVLIFHPYYAGNYDITCEGLTRWNGKPAWQIYFRQNPRKPVVNRAYKLRRNGMAYPVALRGRAWIASDSYQVLRMETDLIAPVPEIQLVAEHTAVEYGPVNFRHGIHLWLPQSAELYFEWKGRRIHRRHSFEKYLLFAVDENQRIGSPKEAPPDLTGTQAAPSS